MLDHSVLTYKFVHLEKDWGKGLGSVLALLSFIKHWKMKFKIHNIIICVNAENATKKWLDYVIANLNMDGWLFVNSYPIEKYDLMCETYGPPIPFGDFCHLFGSPYCEREGVKNTRSEDILDYSHVVLCTHAGYMEKNPVKPKAEWENTNRYPWCKYGWKEYYEELFWYIKNTLKLDVITIDERNVNLEEKIEILEKAYCAIGYEGGIAHLCHVLQVPYVMFPWKKDSSAKFFCDVVHPDRRTWFLEYHEEIFTWDINQFGDRIKDCHHNRGNNRILFGKDYKKSVDIQNGVVNILDKDMNVVENIALYKDPLEREFIADCLGIKKRIL